MSARYVILNESSAYILAVASSGDPETHRPSSVATEEGPKALWFFSPAGGNNHRIHNEYLGSTKSLQVTLLNKSPRLTLEATDEANEDQCWKLGKPPGEFVQDQSFLTATEYGGERYALALASNSGLVPPPVEVQLSNRDRLSQRWTMGESPGELKQTIDLSVPKPQRTENLSIPSYHECAYDPSYACWTITAAGGGFTFNLKLARLRTRRGVNLIFKLAGASIKGVTNCPIDIDVNGQPLIRGFDPHINNFYDMVWPIPEGMLHDGDNEIVLTLASGSTTTVSVRRAIVDMFQVSTSARNWLAGLANEIPISEINLPGTHDSAAINATMATPYACQNISITDQLLGGIRLLDVRLKVKESDNLYQFVTCHGDIGSAGGLNEYQTFPSLLEECRNFLRANTSEVVLMSLKIDDWGPFAGDERDVLNALGAVLANYPIRTSLTIPTLGDVRNSIFLYNRITEDVRFGVPVRWAENTRGSHADDSPGRSYDIYVQDWYKGLPSVGAKEAKYHAVTAAFAMKKPGEVLLNFASATWFGLIGVYIMGDLLDHFGKEPSPKRPRTLGWLMLDFPFEKYKTDNYGWLDLVQLIVASNKNYAGFEHTFEIVQRDEL